jgi:hemoglobin
MNSIASLALAAVLAIAPAAAPTLALADPSPEHPGEQTVDPYTQTDANAGARPVAGTALLEAFHGQAGVARIVDRVVDRSAADPRISDIFKNQDLVRLKRTLKEQFCYLLGGGCVYTGRDMKGAHKDMGIQDADFNALVENRLLGMLAPMHRDVVTK